MKGFLEELLVVLVIYKTRIKESPAYHSLTQALITSNDSTSLVIYDNSPSAQELPQSDAWSIEYLHDNSNPGVSKAYNQGFQIAKRRNKKWLLLVDQDTFFPEDSFKKYVQSIKRLKPKIVVPVLNDHLGIVSPFKFSFGRGMRLKQVSRNSQYRLGDLFFINSGTVVSVECFEITGGFDERLKLDFTDVDFILRAQNKIESFVVANFECNHDLANPIDADESYLRFENYIEARSILKAKFPHIFWFSIGVFFRSFKLSWRFKNFRFMIAYFKKQ